MYKIVGGYFHKEYMLLFWFFSLVFFSVLLGVGSVLVSVFVSAVFLVFAACSCFVFLVYAPRENNAFSLYLTPT
jgi:hypothetical protein